MLSLAVPISGAALPQRVHSLVRQRVQFEERFPADPESNPNEAAAWFSSIAEWTNRISTTPIATMEDVAAICALVVWELRHGHIEDVHAAMLESCALWIATKAQALDHG